MAVKTSSRTAGPRKAARSPDVKRSSAHKSGATHIMPAPKGPRTVSHQRIKAAVEKVFRDRAHADA